MIDTKIGRTMTVVTIDRPHKRNALTSDELSALEATFEVLDTPVACLRGSGSAFCAGADLAAVADLDADGAEEFARHGQRVATAIEESSTVVVAAIDGPARGGGVELALACDLRIATPDATFAETGVRLGLFGAWGGTHRLPRIVGVGNAMDLALSGRTIDAETALRMGLVSRVTDDPETVAASLAENDRGALETIKKRFNDDASPEQQEHREAKAFAACIERTDPD